jgi:hypothetical protein
MSVPTIKALAMASCIAPQGLRAATLAAAVAVGLLAGAASPAFAIQEVSVGPRLPSFAAAPIGALPAGVGAINGLAFNGQAFNGLSSHGAAEVPGWAFGSGRTERIGSVLYNTTSGPAWMGADSLGFGSSSFGASRFGASRFGDLGFTTRNTAGVMATDKLMFYTSVGSTTFNTGSSIVPVAPGLQPFQPIGQRMDARAGFKMELAPGLTFGMEATVLVPPAR